MVVTNLLQFCVVLSQSSPYDSMQAQQSNRVCNALALLQCVASHPETRSAFLNGQSTRKIMSPICNQLYIKLHVLSV